MIVITGVQLSMMGFLWAGRTVCIDRGRRVGYVGQVGLRSFIVEAWRERACMVNF